MRKFTDFLGYEFDLDDPETYEYLPQTWKDADNMMMQEIGYAYLYFEHWHTDWQKNQIDWVYKLIEEYAEGRRHNCNNLLWIQEKLYIFMDEIENMC